MPYLEKFNSDDIHARSIIAGLLSFINQEVFILNTWADDPNKQEIVEVPFYYSATGDERYLQDFFGHTWNNCLGGGLLGNFDAVPRGTVRLESMNIDTGNMTQRWIRGNFNRVIKNVEENADGERIITSENLESFNAYINSIPETMTFAVEVTTATLTDAFKIQQAIIEVFYSSKAFYTTYKGILVPCQVSFPESYGIEKTFEMAYPTDDNIKLTFSLTVETYLPVIDEPNFGSNNEITNVNKMNDWIENKPTTSYDTVEDKGIYAKQIIGDDNSYYVGRSRRDLVKVRMGHNSTSDGDCVIGNNTKRVIDNRSYEMSSVMKNSNRMEKIVFGEFGPSVEDKKIELAFAESTSPDKIAIQWFLTGYTHKVDVYMYKKEDGKPSGIKQIAKYIDASLKEYEFTLPDYAFDTTYSIDIAINSKNAKGKNAKAFAVINANGEVVDVVIENQGEGYDDTTTLEIEYDSDKTFAEAVIIPKIIDGKIVDCTIREKGNYDIDGNKMSGKGNAYIIVVSSAGDVKSNELELAL